MGTYLFICSVNFYLPLSVTCECSVHGKDPTSPYPTPLPSRSVCGTLSVGSKESDLTRSSGSLISNNHKDPVPLNTQQDHETREKTLQFSESLLLESFLLEFHQGEQIVTGTTRIIFLLLTCLSKQHYL